MDLPNATESISYAVRVSNPSTPQKQKYQLLLPHREGRGLIDNPKVTPVGTGYALVFKAEDGTREQIGDETVPVPVEVINAMKTSSGILIINLGEDGEIVDGQLLSLL